MIGEATTVGLSPTEIDGDNFDVFSSLRDGAGGEDFSSGISEEVADSVEQFDLVAVAGGKAELDVAMSDDDTKEDSAPIDPERCRNFGTAACLGCVNLGLCQYRQAAMMERNNDLQPEEQLSTLEQLLREDEAPGEIVWAQVVPETDEAGNLGQTEEVSETASPEVMGAVLDGGNITEDDGSKEQTSNVHDEEDFKAAETTIEVVKDAGVDDYMTKPQVTNPILDESSEMSEQLTLEDTMVLPTSMAVEAEPVAPAVEDVNKVSDDFADMVVSDIQESPQIEVKEPKSAETVKLVDNSLPTSPVEAPPRETSLDNTTVDNTGDYDNSYNMVSEPEEKNAPPVTEQEPSVQMPDASVNVPMENAKHETPTKEVVAVEAPMPAKKQPDQPMVMTSSIQDYVEYGEKVSPVSEESAVDHSLAQPVVVDMPVAHEVVKVVPTENAAIEPEALTPIIPAETVVAEYELWTDPPQDSNQEAAVDQTVYETQTSPVERFDDAVIEERSCGDDEVWAEEDVVFFVEQPSVVEPEAPLTKVVTTGPLTEVTIVTSEETNESEAFVTDGVESIEPLDNLQVASVPEIIKDDYGPVERSMVPVSSAIESVSDVTLDGTSVQMSEEYVLPCKKQDNVITTTPEGNDVSLGSDEPETMAMDGSDAEQSGDLSEEREEYVVIDRVAEVPETELSEQDDLVTDDVADGYGYDSEVNAADDFLIVKHHPSLGLWMDDSRLNPEEETTATVQPGADDVSLVSRLVGVLVVAMCVARGKHTKVLLSG